MKTNTFAPIPGAALAFFAGFVQRILPAHPLPWGSNGDKLVDAHGTVTSTCENPLQAEGYAQWVNSRFTQPACPVPLGLRPMDQLIAA